MRIHPSHNPKPRTHLGGTASNSPVDRLVKPVQELVKSGTETSSKLKEPKTYDEIINNAVHRNR